jgi:type II secretory pathway component PulC
MDRGAFSEVILIMLNETRLKRIMRNISVLNMLLLTAVIALAAYVLPPLLDVNVSYTLPVPKKITKEKEEKPAAAQAPSAMEYAVVAEQNVFHPDRKIPSEKKEEKPLPKPEFVLYGTLITNDTSLAFMEDLKAPYTTAGRGKRQRTLRLGATLSGFTLSHIYEDKVVMARGEDKIEVKVVAGDRAKTDAGTVPGPGVGTPVAPPQQSTAPLPRRGRAVRSPAAQQPRGGE